MSFEEWKKQNLQKAGQSEHLGRDGKAEQQPLRKRPASIQNVLDSLEDDAEIDLDFSGLIPDGPDLPNSDTRTGSDQQPEVVDSQPSTAPAVGHRSKDAGTTCKERYNYASFDCAADILKSNPQATTPRAVLGENKDSYMLNVCSVDNKFLILELCNDLSIDTIVLANFEFFSSTFRTFRVSVSDKYPVKLDKWRSLGTFEARNSREVQAFLVENPTMWARYLRIEFLSHYGSEYYCPVSLVRVHGTTMMEEYRQDLEGSQADDDDIGQATEAAEAAGETLVPEAVADVIVDERKREAREGKQNIQEIETELPSETGLSHGEVSSEGQDAGSPAESVKKSLSDQSTPTPAIKIRSAKEELAEVMAAVSCTELLSRSKPEISDHSVTKTATSSRAGEDATGAMERTITSRPETTQDLSQPSNYGYQTAAVVLVSNFSATASSEPLQKSRDATDASHSINKGTASERSKASPSTTQSQAAAPTMQESFFKSVQKRLQMLESNSSLSLQYIEDQSRALRDAFNKVEQRQLAKTTTFLDYLNTTVLSELRDFRQQYDQLWQSTVIELEMQRERYQQESAAINARLGILADELIVQKRISILQMILILICLGLVLFTRGNLNQYLELPVVQRVLSRSPSSRWLNVATLDTPTQSPPPTREGSVQKPAGILKGHRRTQSEESIEDALSPQSIYSPPTPTSIGDILDREIIKHEIKLDGPEFDPSTIERPSTSPPILPSEVDLSAPGFHQTLGPESIETRLNGHAAGTEIRCAAPCCRAGDATVKASDLEAA